MSDEVSSCRPLNREVIYQSLGLKTHNGEPNDSELTLNSSRPLFTTYENCGVVDHCVPFVGTFVLEPPLRQICFGFVRIIFTKFHLVPDVS